MKTFKTPKGTELPIMDIKGKDYLQAAPRILWLREEHPDWSIETELLNFTEKQAVFKATIRDGSGKILAQATSMETLAGFDSFLEKAETCAVSRAAAFCGYGTLMAQELEEQGKLAESPTERRAALKPQEPPRADDIPAFHLQAPKRKEYAPGDPNGFIVPFGKNKGMTFEQAGRPALAQDRVYWLAKLKEKDEEPGGRLKQYLDEINQYL